MNGNLACIIYVLQLWLLINVFLLAHSKGSEYMYFKNDFYSECKFLKKNCFIDGVPDPGCM